MYFELKEATADVLANSRRRNDLCDLPLNLIASEKEAYDIQAIAQEALGFERKGYAIVGTSDCSRLALGLTTPVYSEIPAFSLHEGVKEFRLPPETIGVQCEFVFTMRRSYPQLGEVIDTTTASDAILSCRPAIGIIGRRTRRRYNGDYAAIADFGLHVATICGDSVPGVSTGEVARTEVTTFLFKHSVFSAKATSVMGDPLNAVTWLAAELVAKGRQLEPNDVVATGSCTKILQVWAGQHLAADFGPLGQIDCVFT